MVSVKLFTVLVTASGLWAVHAGKCKPHTSFLTLTSGASTTTSFSSSYFKSTDDEVDVASSTEHPTSTDSVETISSGMSASSATTLDQPTAPGSSLSDPTATIDSTVSSDDIVIDVSTFSSSPTTDTGDINASTGSDAPHEASVSTGLTTFIEKTTTDTATSAQSTSAEIIDTTETIVTTETTTSMDATTTEFTTISALDSASTTENLWTSTTVVSCPVYSNLLDDPSFEGENNAPNRWELKLQFDGTAVTYQKQSSNSQDVPRAHSGDQFVLLGTNVGTDMRRVVSLDKKKYQLWITYAAISDPDEDWGFNFIVVTRNGHAFRQLTNVPKGEPFVYREESTVFQGWKDDFIQPFVRLNSGSKPRLVAIDDIYVAEYVPSCVMTTEKSELCGGIQGFVGNSAKSYRMVTFDQGDVEICAQLWNSISNPVVFSKKPKTNWELLLEREEEWCSTNGHVGNVPVLTACRLDIAKAQSQSDINNSAVACFMITRNGSVREKALL
ncbi:hypothetical protein FGSG_13692 [Fusarium graminearum PH-1]|uniref:Chromosome 1, complete genome n=1 Tax=Gibberella zeae (strain ATCC MYA-4620 / CBS 123657 / FGSC 9075 / NRRL 31084 / PH-1) TaxID=229533 RepID=I1SA11_GIBZE|nr:hypothetical protein FGSG_13692 [Fusarium graminearum PH-1]ESU16698.1 hypothetical protein FGSG_13692 [Fusarium graminearum PH-1]CEF75367.1 unnamed protein product [Fusarium graminearum]|eukprot:XP_011318960.1 hypothetical protein FGSG_13692 [Fusarium graminearum PH-1]